MSGKGWIDPLNGPYTFTALTSSGVSVTAGLFDVSRFNFDGFDGTGSVAFQASPAGISSVGPGHVFVLYPVSISVTAAVRTSTVVGPGAIGIIKSVAVKALPAALTTTDPSRIAFIAVTSVKATPAWVQAIGPGNTTAQGVSALPPLQMVSPLTNPGSLTYVALPVASGQPVPIIECAFSSNPSDPPIWVDITAYVENFSLSRGRQRELDQIQAGVFSAQLVNADRRFDPTYATGPYFPNVLPMRRIRVRANYAGTILPVWSGYVESWGQHWNSWQDAIVPLTAVDAFKPLNLSQLNTSFNQENSGTRIGNVLDTVGWTIGGNAWTLNTSTLNVDTVVGPTGDRVVMQGTSQVQASILANTSALQHMQDVNDTEGGLLFVDREGAVTFYGRQRAVQGAQLVPLGIFGEQELPYAALDLAYDDSLLWNQVSITRQGGVIETANDATSQKQYYLRTLAKTSTLHTTDLEALSRAGALVSKYSQPKLQVIGMTLDGEANPKALYPQMLGREIGDLVTVRRRPQVGPMIEQPSTIEGINLSFDADGGMWTVTWRLAPSDALGYWVLSDPIASVLNQTTRLFY